MNTTVNYKRVSSDSSGNPRYVFHFLELSGSYNTALQIARKIGGRKFHNKQYGGGIVVQGHNLDRVTEFIQKNKQP